MPKIHFLTEDLINKIAAGEVIERPASVVKELLENSLDAQAKKISIEIKDSGKELIRVSDNGEGMDSEDARHCVLRHTTSKIKDAEDLFAINTLGFRGEALASIAAVSKTIITTKKKSFWEGYKIEVEGGKVIQEGIAGAEEGTTVEVQNLFFNTPARKKFLKTDSVELRHIIDTVIRYALINPQVSFILKHEGHILIQAPATNDFRSTIASIYGTKLAKELLEINHEEDGITISGFISSPYQARNDKSQQFLYVNGRWIHNEGIAKAIYDAYHSLLFVNKHPVIILNLALPAGKIDVNVHPAKTKIKIEQKEVVYKAVFFAIKETLQKNNLIPVLDVATEQQLNFGLPKRKVPKYSFEPSAQTLLKQKENKLSGELVKEPIEVYNSRDSFDGKDFPTETQNETFWGGNVKLPPLKILGQIHKTFFVAETPGGVVFIDQHAAHERVLYEKFMKQFVQYKMEVQQVLQGDLLEFSPLEKVFLLENKETIARFGFHLEPFGEKTFVVKTIPTLLGKLQSKEIIYELLTTLREGRNNLEVVKETIITRMACRAAVMAGETLTVGQMEKILQELAQTELPYTCPHGRPTIIKTPAEELEKKFKRK